MPWLSHLFPTSTSGDDMHSRHSHCYIITFKSIATLLAPQYPIRVVMHKMMLLRNPRIDPTSPCGLLPQTRQINILRGSRNESMTPPLGIQCDKCDLVNQDITGVEPGVEHTAVTIFSKPFRSEVFSTRPLLHVFLTSCCLQVESLI